MCTQRKKKRKKEKEREKRKKGVKAEDRLATEITRMAEALETYLPQNVYTRKRADVRGPSIHLAGFIKHLATEGNEKKIFANKKGGGKSEYSVAILLDISASMTYGRKLTCALETVLVLVGALRQINIENFSVVLFGEKIYPIKLPDMIWDDATIAVLITSALKSHDQSTLDADALLFAAELLGSSTVRGPKRVFVITDGYGSSGLKLAAVLNKLEEAGMDVLAMGVAPDEFFLKKCYAKWVTAALPHLVPTALERLQDMMQAIAEKRNAAPPDSIDWLTISMLPLDAPKTMNEVLLEGRRVFPELESLMHSEREALLKRGNKPTYFTVDICFVMDCTESMGPWIRAAIQQIHNISSTITEEIKKNNSAIELDLHFGTVAYRDYGDGPFRHCVCDLAPGVEAMHSFLYTQVAMGGSDVAEDVLGGLNAAVQRCEWKGKVRFCILIADAPGHGTELHDGVDDDYEDGDPDGLTTDGVMKSLKEKSIHLIFGRIQKITDKMISVFRSKYDDEKFKIISGDIFSSGTSSTAEGLVSKFGDVISDMVVNVLIMDHL